LYQNHSHVLCLDNLKQTALYFERVVPIQIFKISHQGRFGFIEIPEKIPMTVMSELIYGKGAHEFEMLTFINDFWVPFVKSVHKEFGVKRPDVNYWKEIYKSNPISENKVQARSLFTDFAKTLGINNPSILIPQENQNTNFQEAYLSLSLDNVSLVDVSNTSWDQIMEFRKDYDSVLKLRNLRLHIFDNYVGKPQSYIQDKLLNKLDCYEFASKKHGFELTTSTLTAILDSKNIQATVAAGIGVGLFGGVELGIGAACAVELGKVSVELAKKMYSFKDLKNNHEVAYLIKAKEQLEINANKQINKDT